LRYAVKLCSVTFRKHIVWEILRRGWGACGGPR